MKNIIFNILMLCSIITYSACDSKSSSKNPLPSNNWVRDAGNPVLEGSGDITSIGDPTVIYDNGTFKMWMSCIENGTAPPAHVCYATSTDGSTWTGLQIVFSPAAGGSWDDSYVEIPSVIKDENEPDAEKRYKMWYGGSDASYASYTGLAYSPDGITWTRLDAASSQDNDAGLVLKPGVIAGDAGVVSDPSVVKNNSSYHIWYNAFGSSNDLHISYASSADGFNWTRSGSNPLLSPDPAGWEGGTAGTVTIDVSHPTVLWNSKHSRYLMWYGSFNTAGTETYTGIGYATSTDGVTWVKDSGNPVFLPCAPDACGGEELGISTGPAVVYDGSRYHLFYTGADASASRVINHAQSE